MVNTVVADFSKHLKNKRDSEILKKRIETAGWSITADVRDNDSEITVYLIDSKEDGIVIFGCKKADFPNLGSPDIIHWGHFVLAWDVIADPDMAFDDEHKKNTMQFAVRALPALDEWPSFSKRAFDTENGKKSHILIIVDRNDMLQPMELIAAHSTSPVMNVESVKSILSSYIE